MRVSTLPRMSTTSRSGRAALSCAALRGDPVPTLAPSGSVVSVQSARDQKIARVAALGGRHDLELPRLVGGKVLERVDGEIDLAHEQGVSERARKDASAAERG